MLHLRRSVFISPNRSRSTFILASAIASLLPAFSFSADATKTWDLQKNDGSPTANANFFNLENWDLDQRPTFTGNTDSILFNGAGAGTIGLNIAGGLTEFLVKSFTFTGGAYTFNGAQNLTFGDATSLPNNTGNLTNNSTSTQVFNPNSTIAFRFGTINAANGGITFNANPTINLGNNSNTAARNVTVDGPFNVTINSVLAGTGTDASAGGALIKNGTGTLFLQGDSPTWGGRLTINSGAVEVNKGFALGSADGRTTIAGGAATGRLNIKGGINVAEILFLEGRASTTGTPHLVNLSGSNTVSSAIQFATGGSDYAIESAAGNLTISGNVIYNGASGLTNLRLGGDGGGSVGGKIGLGGLGISVVKDGAGTWSLNGANEYTGSTQVNGGRLNLTTIHAGTGPITVNDGAILGVTVTSTNTGIVTESFTLGQTTGATLALDIGAFGNPSLPIIDSTSFNIAPGSTLTIKASGAPLSIGQFTLIDYTGAIGSAGFGGLTLGALPARVTANLINDTSDSRLLLNVSAFDLPKWTGANSSDWDIDDGNGTGTQNWREVNSTLITRYLQGAGGTDSVLFDDTANPGSTNVSLTTTLTPAAVTVNNSVLTYTFSGAGNLSGAASLTKLGTGTLILANIGINDYSGTTTISAGTLQIGDGTTIGAGSIGTGNIINNGMLVLNRPDSFAIGPVIGGNGAIVKEGTGTATLSANNDFTGPVTITAGTLRLGNSNALGGTTAGTTIQPGATLDVNGRLVPAGEIISVTGSGVIDSGAIVNNGTGGAAIGLKNVVFTGATTFGGSTRFDIRDNPGGLNANGFAFTKVGTNNIFLGNVGETHLGDITINSGRFAFEGNTTLGDQPGSVVVNSGAELGLEDSTVAHTKAIQLAGGIIVASAGTGNELASGITLSSDSALQVGTNVTLHVSGDISGTGNLTKRNAGVLILSGNNAYAGNTIVTQGTFRVGNDGPSGTPGTGEISLEPAPGQTATLAFRRSDTALVVDNIIASPGGGTASAGTNVLNIGANNGTVPATAIVTLSGDNSFTGAVNINGGSLRITNSNALGSGLKTVSIASNGKPSLRLDGSLGNITLSSELSLLTSNDDVTFPAIINEAGENVIGGTISPTNANGGNTRIRVDAGTLTLNGTIAPAAGATSARTLILGGAANGTVNGTILSAGQPLGVTKAGTGTWILNAANPYTGNTTIQSGALKLGPGASINASPVINLSTGATLDVSSVPAFTLAADQTLTGTGTILGSVTAGPASMISVIPVGVPTLTFTNDLTLAGGKVQAGLSSANEIGSGGTSLISVGANLAVSAPTSVELISNGAALSGTYRLFGYTGTLSGSAANLLLSHLTRYNLAIDASAPQQINVVATGSAANLAWAGDGSANVWDLNSSANWNNGTEKFFSADAVTFGDGTANTAVTIAQLIAPSSVTVNSSQNYSFGGPGGITGAPGGLTKSGTGTLSLITANTYFGPTVVQEGALLVTGSINGSMVTVEEGGTLGGSGTITTNNQILALLSGARLAPGVATGTLTLSLGTSSLDLSAALDGPSPALLFDLAGVSSSDRITLTSGTLNIGTGVLGFEDFTFTSLAGIAAGNYTLFSTNTPITGSFDPAALDGFVGGLPATLAFADGGSDIVLAIVPEPGSFAFLLGSLGLFAGLHRHRRKLVGESRDPDVRGKRLAVSGEIGQPPA
jgi:fibronectin-binding autotransporter adhesin